MTRLSQQDQPLRPMTACQYGIEPIASSTIYLRGTREHQDGIDKLSNAHTHEQAAQYAIESMISSFTVILVVLFGKVLVATFMRTLDHDNSRR